MHSQTKKKHAGSECMRFSRVNQLLCAKFATACAPSAVFQHPVDNNKIAPLDTAAAARVSELRMSHSPIECTIILPLCVRKQHTLDGSPAAVRIVGGVGARSGQVDSARTLLQRDHQCRRN